MNFLILIPLLLCIWLGFAGCVMMPIPTAEDKVIDGRQVTEEQLSFLTPKITTKQEVLERLGNPVVIWENAHIFVYNWKMRQGIMFWAYGAYYTGGAGMTDIPKHYLLLIQFDEQDLVSHFERTVCPMDMSYKECLMEWVEHVDEYSPGNSTEKRK